MNLTNFESDFDKVILKRGYDYYKYGHVESIENDGMNWEAEVIGSDEYLVSVRIGEDGNIIGTECDCPYDMGEYCKHQAAVLYAIRDIVAETDLNKKTKFKAKTSKSSLEELLRKVENATLITILLEYANQDKQMYNDLMLRFSDKNEIVSNARKLIKSSAKRVMHHGFVEYGDNNTATEGAEKVLDMADELSG